MTSQELRKTHLDSIESAIADIKAGKVVIVVDDEDRENEGDFICAAECITPDIVNFMVTHGRGLVCAPITQERADELQLQMMVTDNTDIHKTAFTVSIDYKHKGCTTGISSYDRATCIQSLTDSTSKGNDFTKPGHIFPLIAQSGGVLRRTGHTEASIDLATMAGFYPAGVLIEILNEDGSMARVPQLLEIAEKFDLKIISIKDLVAYRMEQERLIERQESIEIDTPFGKFNMIGYTELSTGAHHLVLTKGEWTKDEPVLTRVHASSSVADVISTLISGKDSKLIKALRKIEEVGKGVILLLRYEGQPSLLGTIMTELKKQQETSQDLNPYIRFIPENEQKEIGIGSQILNDIGLGKIKLITNNPRKAVGVMGYGLEIVDNIPM